MNQLELVISFSLSLSLSLVDPVIVRNASGVLDSGVLAVAKLISDKSSIQNHLNLSHGYYFEFI